MPGATWRRLVLCEVRENDGVDREAVRLTSRKAGSLNELDQDQPAKLHTQRRRKPTASLTLTTATPTKKQTHQPTTIGVAGWSQPHTQCRRHICGGTFNLSRATLRTKLSSPYPPCTTMNRLRTQDRLRPPRGHRRRRRRLHLAIAPSLPAAFYPTQTEKTAFFHQANRGFLLHFRPTTSNNNPPGARNRHVLKT